MPGTKRSTTPDSLSPDAGPEPIRLSLHRWLDRIEALARAELATSTARAEELERQLHQVKTETEALRVEAERRDREWNARLDALDEDRALLAEAREQLEREQVERLSGPRAAPSPPEAVVSSPPPQRLKTGTTDDDGPISRTILRQFETLRHDVRCRADAHKQGDRP